MKERIKIMLPHDRAKKELKTWYKNDLAYFLEFQRWKSEPDFDTEYQETLKRFLKEFRVWRCLDKSLPNRCKSLLTSTSKWIKSDDPENVDGFATYLQENGLTHGKKMTSMASKILFMNCPQRVFPIDRFVRKAVGLRTTMYRDYKPLLDEFRHTHWDEIQRGLDEVLGDLLEIEKAYTSEIHDLQTIRQNRYVDKLLWAIGERMS